MNALVAVMLANAILVLPIAVCAWASMRFLRRPAIAHVFWVLALIKLLTPPLVAPELIVDPYRWPTLASMLPHASQETFATTRVVRPEPTMPQSVALSSPAPGTVPATAVPSAAQTSVSALPLSSTVEVVPSRPWFAWLAYLLVGVWAVGSLFFLYLFAHRIRLVARLIRSCGKRDSMASALAESLFGQSVRAPPRVILVDAVISPTLIGIGPWTKILFPRRLWEELPIVQRDGLLLHELEHYRRGDHWVRVLEAAATAVFWWHPVIWWARHHIEITEESCCDAVASRDSNEISYAEALLTTLDFINEPCWSPSAPVGTGVSRLPVLEQRLTQIVHHSLPGQLSILGRVGLLIFAGLALPVQPLLLGGRITTNPIVARSAPMPSVLTQQLVASESATDAALEAISESLDLPPAPEGWWTPQPTKSWALSSTTDPGSPELVMNAAGQVLLRGGIVDGTIDLSQHEITAAAFWKSSTRLVTGDAKGQIRLWDVASGEPVSLLGRHRSPVSSLAISTSGTLITGAQNGTLIAWDLQSGEVRATWTTNERPIQSVRLFDNGKRAVVIASDWRGRPATSRIVVLDAELLEPEFDWVTAGTLATTRADNQQLTFVDWSGTLLRFNDQGDLEAFGSTEKEVVSAFVFSQDASLDTPPQSQQVRS